MKIVHKNSREEITEFPVYGKHYYGMYGYLVITYDSRILFFYQVNEEPYFEDVTDSYTIYP